MAPSAMLTRRSCASAAVVRASACPRPAARTPPRLQPLKASGSEAARQEVAAYLRELPGWCAPFDRPWDPLNLAGTGTVGELRRWRESEITHGRVAMIAVVGFLIQEQLEDYPIFLNFDGHIQGQAVKQFGQVRQGFFEPLLIAIGLAESYRVSVGWAFPVGKGFNQLREDYNMGDLQFDPLNLKPKDPKGLKDMQTKELNNGRLAMIAIAGLTVQELIEPDVQIFDHLFRNVQQTAVEPLDVIQRDIDLPNVPNPLKSVPDLPQNPLKSMPDMPQNPFKNMPSNPFKSMPDMPQNPLKNMPDMPQNPLKNMPDMPQNPLKNVPQPNPPPGLFRPGSVPKPGDR